MRSSCLSLTTPHGLSVLGWSPWSVETRAMADFLEACMSAFPEKNVAVPLHEELWKEAGRRLRHPPVPLRQQATTHPQP